MLTKFCCLLCRDISWTSGGDYSEPLDAARGETLQFLFIPSFHNVYRMPTKEAFDNCNFNEATFVGFLPPVWYTITEAEGDVLYFACKKYEHCKDKDQKIQVNVLGDITA